MEAKDVMIMKLLATILFFFLFLTGAFAQTRNVLVNTSSVVVQPTNFWSVNASNARSGLGLGTTNSVTFGTLTIDSGDQVSLNGNRLEFSSFGLLIEAEEQRFIESDSYIFQWGTNSVNFFVPISFDSYDVVSGTRTNLGLSATWLTNTNVTNFRTSIGLGSTNTATFGNVSATSILYAGGATTAINLSDGILRNVSQNVLEFGDSTNIYAYLPIAFISNSFATTTRTNLGLGSSWLTNTNVTNFRSSIELGLSALTNTNTANFRSDIGLGLTVLTNTNVSNFRSSIGLVLEALTNTNNSNFLASFFGSNTNPVLVNTNGTVVSPTNFWQVAPIQTLVQKFVPTASSNSYATNARNLYVYSMTTSITGVVNTVVLPTNSATFDGDSATITHKGTTSSVTAVSQAGSATNFTTISNEDESVKFIREDGQWTFYHNISYVEPIRFTDGNIEANKAASRTNLGLGFAALTNTNAAGFQRAIFSTNSVPSNSANINTINFNTAVAWMEVSVITNGATNSYRIPLFQ